MKQKNPLLIDEWDVQAIHKIIEEYLGELEEGSVIHIYFDELKDRKRYAVEIDFKNWESGGPNKTALDFKKKIEKQGLYCGIKRIYPAVIVSPYPKIIDILCRLKVPASESGIIRGLFFGFRPDEINEFIDEYKRIRVLGKIILSEKPETIEDYADALLKHVGDACLDDNNVVFLMVFLKSQGFDLDFNAVAYLIAERMDLKMSSKY